MRVFSHLIFRRPTRYHFNSPSPRAIWSLCNRITPPDTDRQKIGGIVVKTPTTLGIIIE